MRIMISGMLCMLFLSACGTAPQVMEHQVAVPVEKIVYAPLDPGLFAPCQTAPQVLNKGSTNSALLANRDAWQLRAQCLDDELAKIQSLQNQPKPKP